MDEAIHLLLVLVRDPLVEIEPPLILRTGGNLAGHLGRQVLRVESLDGADSPDSELVSRFQTFSTPSPSGHAIPMPVTTTRRFSAIQPFLAHPSGETPQAAFCFSM